MKELQELQELLDKYKSMHEEKYKQPYPKESSKEFIFWISGDYLYYGNMYDNVKVQDPIIMLNNRIKYISALPSKN